MLLYRFAKMMEQHTSLDTEAAAESRTELQELRIKMEGELAGLGLPVLEEDCSDWASHATY